MCASVRVGMGMRFAKRGENCVSDIAQPFLLHVVLRRPTVSFER